MPKTLTFRLAPRVQVLSRAVGFLEGYGDLDAGLAYDGFPESLQVEMRARMEHWVAGNDGPKQWFHGFPAWPKYKECFVFKSSEHRLYGFQCNPRPKSNPRFRLCVLCIHVTKHQRHTDETILKRVEEWRNHSGARDAIGNIYKEHKKGGKSWIN